MHLYLSTWSSAIKKGKLWRKINEAGGGIGGGRSASPQSRLTIPILICDAMFTFLPLSLPSFLSFLSSFASSLVSSLLPFFLPLFLPFFPFLSFPSFLSSFLPSLLPSFLPFFPPSFLPFLLPFFLPSFLSSFLSFSRPPFSFPICDFYYIIFFLMQVYFIFDANVLFLMPTPQDIYPQKNIKDTDVSVIFAIVIFSTKACSYWPVDHGISSLSRHHHGISSLSRHHHGISTLITLQTPSRHLKFK